MNTLTLALIKPDAVKKKLVGRIIGMAEDAGFEIGYIKRICLTDKGAREFYKEHKDKDFFEELVRFTSSGPIIVLILRKKYAIKEWRKLMIKIRRKYSGKKLYENAVHGADSIQSVVREIEFLYKNMKENRGK